MSFCLSEELEAWRGRMRKLVEERIAPGAQDREEREEFPWDMMDLLREEGVIALTLPKEYGGMEASLLQLCVTVEEICRHCNNSAVLIVFMAMIDFALKHMGTEAQKARYYPRLAGNRPGNRELPTFVLTDEAGGSDVASMESTARLEGGKYIVNGTKRWISGADAASIFIVYAKTNPALGHRGISAFFIDRKPGAEIEGLSIKRERLMSMHSSGACYVHFNNVKIPKENLLGKENEGFVLAMQSLDYSRPLVASRGLGTAQGALDCAIEFAKRRKAFGQKIGLFQGIQFLLADMATKVMAARNLVYMAADNYDRGGDNVSLYASMAKMYAANVAMEVTTDAVQILGGRGATRDYPVQRLMRDAKIIQIAEGTTQIQQMLISRKLMGKL